MMPGVIFLEAFPYCYRTGRLKTGAERRFMARLTEQEQQDIIRFLEADKPLPDK